MSDKDSKQQFVGVGEGPAAPYLIKPNPARHSSEPASAWPTKLLGEIARTASGGTPKRDKPQFYGGPIAWVKSGELRDGFVYEAGETITRLGLDSSSAKIFPKGTLCIALYGATVGRLGILDIEAATNQAVCGIFPTDAADAKYLFYFLFSKRGQLIRDAKGGAQPNISQQIVRELRVPLPPLAEQRRIVAELETQLTRLDASVTALKRVQANLKRYRASVLKAACEGRLRDVGGTASQNWTATTLGKIAKVVGGLTKNPKRQKLENQLPYLRVANVYANALRLEEIEHIGIADSELAKLLLKSGDLLIVEGNGSKDQIGRVALWDGSIDPCVHQNHLIKARLSDAAIPKWVLFWLLSPQGRKLIEKVSSSTSGLHTLSVGKVAALSVLLPPLAEQHRIVAEVERRLSVIDGIEAAVAANLKRAERLRQSVLARAFAG